MMPTKVNQKKSKLSALEKKSTSTLVTPTQKKTRKTSEDDSDNSIDDFVIQEFRVHCEAALRKYKKEDRNANIESNLFPNSGIDEAAHLRPRDCETKGHCPKFSRKRGFGIIEADNMANELMGVVMHAEDLLDDVHEALNEIKGQFKAALWGAERWKKKHEVKRSWSTRHK